MAKFAAAVGVYPQHVFGTSMVIFLSIVAVVFGGSSLLMLIGWIGSSFFGKQGGHSSDRKDLVEGESELIILLSPNSLLQSLGRRTWWKRRLSLNSFHGSVMYGNLVRLLILFHLPITIYCCYHLTLDASIASTKTKVLAGLSFTLFSLLLPAWLIFRIATTNTSKLYEATRTLLALGPLYNQHQQESQLFCCLFFGTNVVTGLVIGFGQKSGIVQAVIILVVEVLNTLATSVWLPWMNGAHMGFVSFMLCVARIVSMVLVIILAPPVGILLVSKAQFSDTNLG